MDKLIIVNAEDLKDTSFACSIDHKFDIEQLDISYDVNKKTLTISPKSGETFTFNMFKQITFGSASKKDLNLCDGNTYFYRLKDG